MRKGIKGTAGFRAAVPFLRLGWTGGLLLLLLQVRAQQGLPRVAVALHGGWSGLSLDWSIAGSAAGTGPNVLSELKWKKVGGPSAGVNVEIRVLRKWTAEVRADYRHTVSGTVTDADYAGDNRTDRNYYARFRSDRGGGMQLSGTMNRLLVQRSSLALSAGLGYGYGNTLLRIREGAPDPNIIATGLNSSYQTVMHGPEAALQLEYRPAASLSFRLRPGYQWLMYRGRGNWNLATDLKHPLSFEQLANGHAWQLGVSAAWRWTSACSFFSGVSGRYVEIREGDDLLYKTDGKPIRSRFNGASGREWSVVAGVRVEIN